MSRRGLGQHYLTDSSVVNSVISLAEIGEHDRVMEVGTGRGALTIELAKLSDNVVAYEIDEQNFRLTKKAIGGLTCRLYLGDAFKSRLTFDILVASIPYSRSSTFVQWLSKKTYRRAVVILQEDFARKICAAPGERAYRAISVIAQIASRMTIVSRVKPLSFDPVPKVNSTIVVFEPRERLTSREILLIKKLFSLKNRQLSRVLKVLGLNKIPIPETERNTRPRSMSVDRVRRVLKAIEGDSARTIRRGSRRTQDFLSVSKLGKT